MRIIIIETFNISIIFGLLRTYYLALIQYGQNYNLDFYSVLVTSIVIPIILQILNNIFDKEKIIINIKRFLANTKILCYIKTIESNYEI